MAKNYFRVVEDIPNLDGSVNINSTKRKWERKEWLATHKTCPTKWKDLWKEGKTTMDAFSADDLNCSDGLRTKTALEAFLKAAEQYGVDGDWPEEVLALVGQIDGEFAFETPDAVWQYGLGYDDSTSQLKLDMIWIVEFPGENTGHVIPEKEKAGVQVRVLGSGVMLKAKEFAIKHGFHISLDDDQEDIGLETPGGEYDPAKEKAMQLNLQHSTPGTRSSTAIIDQDYLADIVKRLSFPRVYSTPENARAEELVATEFVRMFGSCFRIGKTRNVCFGWPNEARVLIGAHFDSVPNTPGADDNASAVAVMLAVAKALGMRRDVMYVAFNAEECDLAGSREFVVEMAGEMKLLKQVHVLEMVGYRDRRPNSQKNPLPMLQAPTTGDFLAVVANQGGLVERIIEEAGGITVPVVGLSIPEGMPLNAIQHISPHLLRSDHAPFWEKGIPAVMWTDTSEFRNPNYHQPSDTPETLDYEFMAEVGKLLVEMVGK